MIKFKEEDVDKLWSDFTCCTNFENQAKSFEDLKSWDFNSIKENESYIIQYVPFTKEHQSESLFDNNISDNIFQLFGIQTPYILVKIINEDVSSRELLSALSVSFRSTNFHLPFFIQLEDSSYIGMEIKDTGTIFYSTQAKYIIPNYSSLLNILNSNANETNEFSTLSNILNLLNESFCPNKSDISYSALMYYQTHNLKYNFYVCGIWDNQNAEHYPVLNFEEAPKCYISISTNYIFDFSSDFIQKVITEQMENDNNKHQTIQNNKNIKSSNFLKSITINPNLNILSNLSLYLLDKNFEDIWNKFCNYLEECYRNKTLIENMNEEEIDLNSPIIYQNLQILNFYINKLKNNLNTSNFILSSIHYIIINKIIMNNIIIKNKIDLNVIYEVRDIIIKYKSNCKAKNIEPNLEYIKRIIRNKQIQIDDNIIENIFKAVLNDLFNPIWQCEFVLNWFRTLSMNEYIIELVSYLIFEDINEIKISDQSYYLKEVMSEIKSEYNLVKKQFEFFSFKEILEKFFEINEKLNLLKYKIKLTSFLSKHELDSLFLNKLIRKGKCELGDKDRRQIVKKMLNKISNKHKGSIKCTIQVIVKNSFQTNDTYVSNRLFVSKSNENVIVATATCEQSK